MLKSLRSKSGKTKYFQGPRCLAARRRERLGQTLREGQALLNRQSGSSAGHWINCCFFCVLARSLICIESIHTLGFVHRIRWQRRRRLQSHHFCAAASARPPPLLQRTPPESRGASAAGNHRDRGCVCSWPGRGCRGKQIDDLSTRFIIICWSRHLGVFIAVCNYQEKIETREEKNDMSETFFRDISTIGEKVQIVRLRLSSWQIYSATWRRSLVLIGLYFLPNHHTEKGFNGGDFLQRIFASFRRLQLRCCENGAMLC